jgi:hypothetical protein
MLEVRLDRDPRQRYAENPVREQCLENNIMRVYHAASF